MPSYTVREWDKIAHGEGEGEILLRHADKLASLAARSIFAGRGGRGVLENGRNALRARVEVWILANSEVSMEIHIGRAHVRTPGTNAQHVWRLMLEKKKVQIQNPHSE